MENKQPNSLNEEDAFNFITHLLRESDGQRVASDYGYDLYLSKVMERYGLEVLQLSELEARRMFRKLTGPFYAAAWDLCRRGILRPGVNDHDAQETPQGNSGGGFSITPFGKQWLAESDKDNFVPTEPGRFSEMLSPYSEVFGPGFHERVQQANRCYASHTYLACCVMSGAAAESILLHLAITKDGDEEKVLKQYRAANGRRALENKIIGEQKGRIKSDFEICFGLLKYWRDEAAHGRKSDISENEAFTSIALLLRCAQFAKDNYETLTGKKT